MAQARRVGGFTLIELMVVVAVIALLIAILMPALSQASNIAKQIKCAGNLSNLGKAFHQYANRYEGKLPALPHAQGNPWRYTGYQKTAVHAANGSVVKSNTRSLYTFLVRESLAPPASFICAATQHVPVKDSEVKTYFDFPNSKTIDYSYQNTWIFTPKLTDQEDFPIMADRNPLVKFNETTDGDEAVVNDVVPVRNRVDSAVTESANSANHGGRGQNVLFIGGHVKWFATPVCGVSVKGKVDNIYTRHTDADEYGQPIADSGWDAGPSDRMDSWFVP